MNRNIFIVSFLLVLSACASGDNKETSTGLIIDGEPVVPRSANRLYIAPIAYPGGPEISRKLAARIRDQINMDGRLAVVDDRSLADLKLQCVITSFNIQDIQYGDMGRPIKKRMRITVGLRLTDIKKRMVIFFDREIQAFKEYSEIRPPVTSESLVRERVIQDLARRIRAKTITGWFTEYMTPEEKGKKKG